MPRGKQAFGMRDLKRAILSCKAAGMRPVLGLGRNGLVVIWDASDLPEGVVPFESIPEPEAQPEAAAAPSIFDEIE